ncbi:ABC transporter substrate-binding protein [Actinopolymorpha pittospori]
MKLPKIAAAAAAAMALVALAGCGSGGDPLANETSKAPASPAPAGTVVVGSADFPESTLIGEIYAGALQAKGVKVEKKFGIGAREIYLKALEDGSIDLIPEYTGNLLQAFDPKTTASTSEDVYAELKKAVPSDLTVLAQASAEDKDAVGVTKETATKYKLKTLSDLKPHAKDLVLGGPPEWKTRERSGVPALEKVYGLTFKGDFKSLKGTLLPQALANGQIDAANIFTTDPVVQQNGFVLLEDDKNLFPAQNVVPLINKSKATPEVSEALDAVSAKLDTKALSSLLTEVVVDKKEAATVAKDWLNQNGLV